MNNMQITSAQYIAFEGTNSSIRAVIDGQELALCQRYYWAMDASNYSSQYAGTNSMINWYYPVTMSATPSVSYSQGGGGSFSSNYVSRDKTQAYYTGDTSVYANNFTADAEL